MEWAREQKLVAKKATVLTDSVAAVSVGLLPDGTAALDLPYTEDSAAETDMNVVATGGGDFVEIQGTAEGMPFTRDQLNELLDLAATGTEQLTQIQKQALAE